MVSTRENKATTTLAKISKKRLHKVDQDKRTIVDIIGDTKSGVRAPSEIDARERKKRLKKTKEKEEAKE